ncbi:hypothetical protein ABZ070_11275 [Streptomyces sp. NPDC006283]|uniref:DUF7737 domain-containing protein n=1 Tax=Streptomyces sp. NPDC006283 TaxID=3156741 RepID=UPI0033BE1E6B
MADDERRTARASAAHGKARTAYSLHAYHELITLIREEQAEGRPLPGPFVALVRRTMLDTCAHSPELSALLRRMEAPLLNPGEAWADQALADAERMGDPGREPAVTRRDLLARLVPRLAIAGRCTLDGRFLHVRGDRNAYRIHLGSGNVLIDQQERYLCIVPKAAGRRSQGICPSRATR